MVIPVASTVGIGRSTWPTWGRVLIAVLVLAAGIVIAGDGLGWWGKLAGRDHHTLNSAGIGSQIGSELTQFTGQEQTVTCPEAVPLETNYIFDCTLVVTADGGGYDIRVTENDARGHYTWQVTPQHVGPAFSGGSPPVTSGAGG